jgi:hypothetical protein
MKSLRRVLAAACRTCCRTYDRIWVRPLFRPRVAALATMLLATAWAVSAALAQVPDARYPDLRAQWTRADSAQFDPSKPGGLRQQIPYTGEYQARWEAILADRAKGGLENNTTASCIPSGMPRTMIVYETMETIVTPDTTYIRGSYMNELRRIFTDGRDWPGSIEPSFMGYSIGRWLDENHAGKYDVLAVETRGLKGPRTFDGNGAPLHQDNQTVIKERIYLDKADPDILHDDITTMDHALTRPWSVQRKYHREPQAFWSEYICEEDNQQVIIGKENYFVSADGYLMPTKKNQPPPDLRNFQPPQK